MAGGNTKYVEYRSLREEVMAKLGRKVSGAIGKAATAGKRAVKASAPGSIGKSVKVASGRKRKKKGRTERTVLIESAAVKRKYHAAYPEWGTATQEGQHFGRAGLVSARKKLDELADGLMERPVDGGEEE